MGARLENQRNGSSPKTLGCEDVRWRWTLRARPDGSFQPKIVKKRQRRFVASAGSSVRREYPRALQSRALDLDIEEHLAEVYSVKVGRDLISRATTSPRSSRRRAQAATGFDFESELSSRSTAKR
jgi:transposase-like protein